MFYYKGKLHPLLSSHPDIQKAWKAWDDIILFWEKRSRNDDLQSRSRNDDLQSTENFHGTDQEARFYDSGCKNAEDHQTQPASDSVSKKNPGVTKLEETQELDCRQSTGNRDLK